MERRRCAFALVCLAALAGCGLRGEETRRRTLPGVGPDRAFAAARRALAAADLELEEAEPAEGTLLTAWQDRPRVSVRYEVTVGGQEPSGATVAVRAERRERVVRGWSRGYPWPTAASRLLASIEDAVDDVPEIVVDEVEAPAAEPPPECRSSRECPPGQHCTGRGRCVWECATDGECEGGATCDRRGRCVEPSPPPQVEAAPAAPAAGEEGAP